MPSQYDVPISFLWNKYEFGSYPRMNKIHYHGNPINKRCVQQAWATERDWRMTGNPDFLKP